MNAPMPEKVRVVVLGGGVGAMSAAWALSATPALRERFAVTVFTLGHRLGGKGATGRDPDQGMRIEEHGLHMWMGWYRTAFRMMADVFEAWRPPPGCPMRGIEGAFSPQHRISVAAAGEAPWHLSLPPTPGLPWADAGPEELGRWVQALVHFSRAGAWGRILGAEGVPLREQLRRARVLARLSACVARGLARDVVPHGLAGFDRIDAYDLRAWLARHGAEDEVVRNAPPIQALYDLGFAYPDGRSGAGRGCMAAGAGIRTLLRIAFTWRGAPLWRMRYGMGDTIFSPLYEVLSARGVRFAFFHRVTGLRARAQVEAVDFAVEARVRGGPFAYRPLIPVRGVPCWPAAPLAAQLRSEGPAALRLARGRDFDAVVLGIPGPALAPIAGDLMARSPAFDAAVRGCRSVATAAMQLWMKPDLAGLGWTTGSTVMTAGARPFASYADMSEVLAAEDWGPDGPRSVAYFCDAAPDRPRALEALAAEAEPWMDRELPRLFPATRAPGGGFDRGQVVSRYLRVNDSPTERYVLTPPGTTGARLAPGGSGFPNLVLAGDWLRTSVNGGCVEAAAESGVAAASALEAQALATARAAAG